MAETCFSRDLPVLRAIVEAFDDPARYNMQLSEIEAASGRSASEDEFTLLSCHMG
jgi:hypothetical protein